ncbi:hypothetical protein UA08_01111 [Talaromyces atroroseus]|uniref:AB hydrolase-1 domain-containing protein n=1 Tax=Talaromyces atroroseus TaxID=1441469 RepID=A0A225BA99_TALAT|nr:hypothetical protein UA08_01111 [Talaromyces atroroseus]OKL63855.1 hypothetical protein UA08_01111 [Talaromyces atroroseus]
MIKTYLGERKKALFLATSFQPLKNALVFINFIQSRHEPWALDLTVHGLGDSHSTWTVDDTLWLRDLLPRLPSFQSARVMTFGYDARSFLRSLSLSLHGRTFTFAEALLNDLEDKRFSIADKNRPIIFIGHSLGGLVVKSALRHANERRSLYGTISSSTRAILFFGTPHQGCDVAAYLSGLGKAILLKNTEVVDELARWSAPLVELTTAFSEIAPRYNITTFFEQRPTNGVIIVPEASARMGQGNERVRGLDADHLSLCRFTGADGTWNMVANRLEAVADNIRNDMAGEEAKPQDNELLKLTLKLNLIFVFQSKVDDQFLDVNWPLKRCVPALEAWMEA